MDGETGLCGAPLGRRAELLVLMLLQLSVGSTTKRTIFRLCPLSLGRTHR